MHPILLILILAVNLQAKVWASSDPSANPPLPPKPALQATNTPPPCGESLERPLGLSGIVDLALCNNPQTRAAWINSRVYAAQVGISKAGYLPGASLNASGGRSWTGSGTGAGQSSAGVTLSYLLYDFGARAANLEAAQQLFAAANASRDSTVQAVFLAAVQAFYRVQATHAALDAALESERAARESFAAAEARYNAGTATRSDKLQAQTAYSQATLNRISADGSLKNAQGELANMIGLDAHRNVPLAPADTANIPEHFEGDINALIEAARQRRPDLQAAAAQVKAAEASADAARASGRPTLSLSASANRNINAGQSSNSSFVGINLNVPLFSGYAPTYRARAAEAQAEAGAVELERLRLQVALDVWTAYQNLVTATQSLRTTADLFESAEQSERVVLGRYKAGVGNILDVLNAQSALAGARQQRVQSTFNWNISRAILAQAMGNLDANLLQTLSPDTRQPDTRENASP